MHKPNKLAYAVLHAIWGHHNPRHIPFGVPPKA